VRDRAVAVLLALCAAVVTATAGEDIYYRKDSNGALVLTNVPDHEDLRTYSGRGPLPGLHSGEEYRDLIQRTAVRHGVHPDLVYAIAEVESNFNPRAVSAKGALGLMQLMPDTATRFGITDPFDPGENVLAGVRYLRYLLDLFRGDSRLALAAYNAGENIVLATGGIPPYRETRNYVSKVLKLFGASKTPYLAKRSARSVAGGRATESPIYTYTDEAGVVHFSDNPSRGDRRLSGAAGSD
jgi:Transglycosylase SLT domain/Domain of unknown function (DUF4124)